MSLSIRPYPTLETTQDLTFKLGIQTYISLALNTDQKWTLTCFMFFTKIMMKTYKNWAHFKTKL